MRSVYSPDRGAVTLTITRGLPASGKTTWARVQQRAARVNRDELRKMLHGGWQGTDRAEHQVTVAQHAAVRALLTASVDVICDDTNLRAATMREWAKLAESCGARLVVQDFTNVPLEECLRRDEARPPDQRVGAEAIRNMFQRYLAGRALPLPGPQVQPPVARAPGARYTPPPGAPSAVLVDLDGTVAVLGSRSPYDMRRVGEDAPNRAVIETVRALHAAGHRVIYCTGRSSDAREATEAWLAMHVGVAHDALLMRKVGDTRRDSVVKAELFERHLRHEYDILCVLDDRQQVVAMWRALGLIVFQVDEGNF